MARTREFNAESITSAATSAANAETTRLLSDYAKLDQAGRTEDQQAMAIAVRDFDLRLDRLRLELETVAVNTEDSFYQTQQGLTQLASLAIPDANEADHTP